MWPFHEKTTREPPQLSDPPRWMVEEVQRRTGLSADVCRNILQRATVAEYHEIVAARDTEQYQNRTGDTTDSLGPRHDPIEDEPAFAADLLRASLEAEREVGADGDFGRCFLYWECKKRILRDRYGIAWFHEAELNPDWTFD